MLLEMAILMNELLRLINCIYQNCVPFPIAYSGPKIPPKPPELPIVLSITYPPVYFVTWPFSLNVNEIDCGGHSTLIFVALPNGPSPECRALK